MMLFRFFDSTVHIKLDTYPHKSSNIIMVVEKCSLDSIAMYKYPNFICTMATWEGVRRENSVKSIHLRLALLTRVSLWNYVFACLLGWCYEKAKEIKKKLSLFSAFSRFILSWVFSDP